MSLYGLDDSVRGLLQVDNFIENDFSAKLFIEKLSAIQEQKAGSMTGDTLDPRPYIRTFEAVLGELKKMKDKADLAERDALEQVRSMEIAHSRAIVGLGKQMEAVSSDFLALDGLVTEITASTSSLTDRLERLSGQLEQTQASSFLVSCYLSFCRRNMCPELEKMWETGGTEVRRTCAITVGQLQDLARKVAFSESSQEEIDKFAERIERDLLQQFDDAYRAADIAIMKESADIAHDFNGGDRVVQIFVNQHEFFIMQDKLSSLSELEQTHPELWEHLADPREKYTDFDQQIQDFVDDIIKGTQQETDIIKKVFRNPLQVLKVFLQRTFAQRIQEQLESVLRTAESISTLAFLRALHTCYTKIGRLIKVLKEIETAAELDLDGELTGLLDQNFSDIFLPFIENGRYFEMERKNLQELSEEYLAAFHRAIGADGGNGMGSGIGGNGSAGNAGIGGAFADGDEKGRIGQFMKAVRLERTSSSRTSHHSTSSGAPTTPTTDVHDFSGAGGSNGHLPHFETQEITELSVVVVQKILKAFAEAVKRTLELTSGMEMTNDCMSFLKLLIEIVHRDYINAALDDVTSHVTNYSSPEPDFIYFRTISQACASCQLVSVFSKTVLLPIINGQDAPNTTAIEILNSSTARVEKKCNSMLTTAVTTVLTRVSQILSKQKKRDFQQKEESNSAGGAGPGGGGTHSSSDSNSSETAVCQELCGLLEALHYAVQQSLDGGNAEHFLMEVGLGLRSALMRHIKKFTFSQTGGVILSHDLQRYQEVIDEWSITELGASFSILHAIANLYTADPQVLPSLLRDKNLAQMRPYLLREYLAKRQDYGGLYRSGTTTDMFSVRRALDKSFVYPL